MEFITKEEMTEIMRNTICYFEKDVSDVHHDIREYERLEEEDFVYVAEDVLEQMEELFSKKRSAKIQKIKNNINNIN